MTALFFILLGILVYTYLGYGLIIWTANKLSSKTQTTKSSIKQEVTVVIAAYNEENYIADKLENTLSQNYPKDKLKVLVVADGSTDKTSEIAKTFNQVHVMHENKRSGKTAALNRAMKEVNTPFVIFTDANAMLNKDAVSEMMKHFTVDSVGCVAGEKRVQNAGSVGQGEGLYWKYESFLKLQDYKFYTAVGAAGELFGLRTSLYQPQKSSIILDDFMLSMEAIKHKYIIAYEPNAYALEHASSNLQEELKRKIRISAGGLQSSYLSVSLLNPFQYGKAAFLLFSHRVMRWTLAPLSLAAILPFNVAIASEHWFFMLSAIAQLLFYGAAFLGYGKLKKGQQAGKLTIPFYFLFMNWSVFLGFVRIVKGTQSAVWEKAKRLEVV